MKKIIVFTLVFCSSILLHPFYSVVAYDNCSEARLRNLGIAVLNCSGDSQKTCTEESDLSGPGADPGQNAEAVWRYFSDKLPAHQIAGIIGNMSAESAIQPQRLQGTKSGVITPAETVDPETQLGWGLVQWTPARKIINTFNPKTSADIINSQLDFLWSQLNGGTPSSEKSAGDQLKKTTTPREAAEIFARKYERPAESSLQKSLTHRISNAEGAYTRFKDSIPTVAQPVTTSAGTQGSPEATKTLVSDSCQPSGNSTSTSSVVEIANQELNKGPVEYDDNVLKYSNGKREAWCADFVSWVHKEAGEPFTGGDSGGWRIASVLSLQSFYKNTTGYEYFAVGEKTPQPGDVAFYIGSQTPDGGSTGHTNIVVSVSGDSMTTIGGNEGNKVKKSNRKILFGSQSLVGFGRIVK